jgi:hypothetical protein
MRLDFFTHWMITGGVGALLLLAAWILLLVDRRQSRKRPH